MAAAELRSKSVDELKEMLGKAHREQFNLRVQRATNQLADPSSFKKVGRSIARIKTILNEKQIQAES